MLRTVKPRNARSKRALDKREPKAVENPKTTLFLRGTSASEIVQSALNDIHALKNPLVKKFTKKNAVYPFEDATPLEFFSTKNDTSLLLLASHSKKRPHNLIFMRTFDHRMLDIVELGLDPESFLPLTAFKNAKPAVGLKPMLAFQGAVWDSDPRFKHLRSIFMDFFRGPTVPQVDVEGLQYLLTFSATETTQDSMVPVAPKVHFRGYLIKTKKSGQKLPRVEVEEMGPRMDFTVRRVQEPDGELLKEAMKQAKKLEPRTKKNIEMDIMGDKLGRIHTGKQELDKMQSRKMKGLKRSKMDDEPDSRTEDSAVAAVEGEERSKRTRTD